MNNPPLISVALCTYNGENYLSEQLDSIINQTQKVDEIVVCDDWSTDGTFSIVEEYAKKYPGIFKIIQNKEQIGVVKNFEQAIEKSTGEIIILSDQDDVWYPEKVETIAKVFSNNKEVWVLAHNLDFISESAHSKIDYFKLTKIHPEWNQDELALHIVTEGKAFPGMSLALRKEAKVYLPFIIKKGQLHDYQLILRALSDNRFSLIDEILSSYRIHDDQKVGSKMLNQQFRTPKQHLYQQLKRKDFVESVIINYNLNPELKEAYRKKIRSIFNSHVNNYPIYTRFIVAFKLKRDFPELKNFISNS